MNENIKINNVVICIHSHFLIDAFEIIIPTVVINVKENVSDNTESACVLTFKNYNTLMIVEV